MPDYRKKKHSKVSGTKSNTDYDDGFEIKVKTSNNAKRPDTPRIIKGNKEKNKFKFKILFYVCSLILVVVFISYLVFPVGIGETLTNYLASIGSGEYPIDISGSKVLNVASNDNYFFLLTDMNIYSYSDSGKTILKESHGFSNPVIKSSKTRALVYDQGQKTFGVFTINDKLFSKSLDSEIICADVCDSGNYAIATLSNSYSSTFSVYDKNSNVLFTWNCAKETINSVSLSPNGKKVSVSTFIAENGDLSSKVYLFDIDSTDPIKSFEYKNQSIYSLYSNRNGTYVVTDNNYDFIRWKADSKTENSTEFSVNFFRNNSSGPILVLNRKNDRTDNTVLVLTNKGEKQVEFSFNGNISDIRRRGSHIYLISEANVYIYDLKGSLVSKEKCEQDNRFIIPTGSRNVCVVSDNLIDQIYIK